MKQKMSSEFLFQLFALLITVIVVHALYVGIVRPTARAHIEREAAMQKAKVEFVPTRSFAVVIGDYEQEAEVILTIWVLAFMGYKARRGMRERDMLDRRLLEIPEGTSVLPQDAREYSRALEALPEAEQDYLLPRTLLSALQRFATGRGLEPEIHSLGDEHADATFLARRVFAQAVDQLGGQAARHGHQPASGIARGLVRLFRKTGGALGEPLRRYRRFHLAIDLLRQILVKVGLLHAHDLPRYAMESRRPRQRATSISNGCRLSPVGDGRRRGRRQQRSPMERQAQRYASGTTSRRASRSASAATSRGTQLAIMTPK